MNISSNDSFSPKYIKNSPIRQGSKNSIVDSSISDFLGGLKNSSNNYQDSQQYCSNPFDSSDCVKCNVPPLFSKKGTLQKERMRHSYPNNSFIRKTRDLRSFIMAETERLVTQDNHLFLGANVRQEVEHLGSTPNCSIRKRMMRMGLL